MGGKLLTAGLAGLALAGCTTTSFAPPDIEMGKKVTAIEAGTCVVTTGSEEIRENVAGAMALIDNVLGSYHCASRDVANGRQAFEIPSFLALIAAGIGGPVYGLSENEVLAAGAYSAVMGRANSYFAPKDKANVLLAAIDGVVCIQNASVGYDYFDPYAGGNSIDGASLQDIASEQDNALKTLRETIASIEAEMKEPDVTAERMKTLKSQREGLKNLEAALARETGVRGLSSGVKITPALAYFKLVKGGLYQVDLVIAKRLSESGTFDAAGIAAELEKYNGQQRQAEEDQEELVAGTKAVPTGQNAKAALINVELEELDAKIQKCVVLAKTR